MTRLLLAKSIEDLEAIVRRNLDNSAELRLVLDELRHRSTQRARDLEKVIFSQGIKTAAAGIRGSAPKSTAKEPADVLSANPPAPRINKAPRPVIMSETSELTNAAVAALRAKLLDLSRRNPLISFKHSGRSATMLRVIDERPDLLFDSVCQEGGVRFEPLPDEEVTPKDEQSDEFRIAHERARLTDEDFLRDTEQLGDSEDDAQKWEAAERALRKRVRADLGLPYLDYGKGIDIVALARAHGFDPSFDLKASDDEAEGHHEDDRLRVLLTPKQLDTRLKSIWDRYRSHERETGLHTLFLAIGFVQWVDEGAGDTPQFAPALLLAVELERRIVRNRYEYALKTHEEGIQINVALAEKMRQHWALEMPQLREGETPESYFVRLAAVLEKGRKLKLRRFVTLAVLPFPRMILWKDLDPANWPEDEFAQHRLLPGLLGAAPLDEEPSPSKPYDIDSPEWADRAPALVLPADASQHSALIEMAQGANLAVEGPPGTGKSQTIANMVATAVGQGKKVLFVAEKQAALRVVADRLKDIGLAPLILELHGEGAKRDEFYKSLRLRLDAAATVDSRTLSTKRKELVDRRTFLRNYLALLDAPLGLLSRSAYELVWREISLRSRVNAYAQRNLATLARVETFNSVDEASLRLRRNDLDVFGRAVAALDEGRSARTRWLAAESLPTFGQNDQLEAARLASQVANDCGAHLAAFCSDRLLTIPAPAEDLAPFVSQLRALEPLREIDEAHAMAALRAPDLSRSLLQKQTRWRQLVGKLETEIEAPGDVTREATNELATALSALRTVPRNFGDLVAELEVADRAVALELDSRAARNDLVALLKLPADISIAAMFAVVKILVALAENGERQLTMMSDTLLDPIAGIALQEEADQAQQLTSDHAALLPDLRDEGLEEDPAELTRIAEVLDDSGFFARLFGSEFKAARKRAARLLRDTVDREATAELLRKTARHRRASDAFRADSTARALFPAVLWKGSQSDFAGMVAARDALENARANLAAVGLTSVLEEFLAVGAQQRGAIGRKAAEALSGIRTANELAMGDIPVSELAAATEQCRHCLANADRALRSISAQPSCELINAEGTLPDRLAAVVGAREDFDRLRASPHFEMVQPIDVPLEMLARALQQTDIARSADDPFGITKALSKSTQPVKLSADLAEQRDGLLAVFQTWQQAADMLSRSAGIARPETLGEGADGDDHWSYLASVLSELASDASGARMAADLTKYRSQLDEAGLEALATAAIDGQVPTSELADVYELAVVARLLKEYLHGDGRDLQRAGGLNLAAARESFVHIDQELHSLEAQAILAERLEDAAPWGIGHGPKGNFTNNALLSSELALKKPRTPIRELVHRAGEALQTLKPVWMMSPGSAAQYIRPGSLDFDLLIVDEASQMRPEYAISAVLRGGQFVVVGDANQLPPSDHFQTKDGVDGDDDSLSITADTESILDVANQRFRRKRRLKWHYRSQHESLIAFSNREFYDNDLVVFPSPMGNDDELLGLRCIYVPSKFSDTVYDASLNQREAEALILEAFSLMRRYPQNSIGIAAMNAKQTDLIAAEFDRLTLEQPEVRAYVDRYRDTIDEFFIKNLENVQGDERDIILISTVYGPGLDGVCKQNFGLMNREVGWRRLNVLVTRAKLSTRVFTSLRPSDVKATDTSSRGVRAFQSWLTFIHGGATVDRADGVGEAESPFEVFVADELQKHGFEVIPQVGVERFRIDLGVRHPDYPLGFIAGVECDGAPFHRDQTVRDRDRIRQKQLENLGWHIYRVWSVDWYADPERETSKLVRWLEAIQDKKATALAHKASIEAAPNEPETQVQESSSLSVEPDANTRRLVNQSTTDAGSAGEPIGTKLRPVDGIDWFEEEKGWFYTVWRDGALLGDITVLSRGDSATKLYGDRIYAPKPEYEGRIKASGEHFKTNDIYAAVREISRRA